MNSPVRLGRIDYLNVWPVYYGFDLLGIPDGMMLHAAPPAELNGMLEEGLLDISAISAFAYAKNHKDWMLVPDLGIGCDGRVMSVLLVSVCPLESLDGATLGLSRESESAASLLRFFLRERGLACMLDTRRVRSPEDLEGLTGGLVIGDAALCGQWSERFPYIYDLAELWKNETGLPFVFGLWAVRREVVLQRPEEVGQALSFLLMSKAIGMNAMKLICQRAAVEKYLAPEIVKDYFNCLDYGLPPSHIKGLVHYFQCMEEMGFIDEAPEPVFLNSHASGLPVKNSFDPERPLITMQKSFPAGRYQEKAAALI
ncbi:menaquinone biosynthetic enzyme MqnA/MqnD family protein [Desulfobotulus mexicanus]|uniref:Chorismate dehydratase n=1 Tax=Desulfobotulus mexicanus TaxID=2586642 RepID=A0A5Q4VFH2_9BACT|nr:menaquinone biosynthesis protein [Desulfobotulus mexicanus]TYT75636.1 menaquinone biosynthesis protein [Desulfobotulus mexicanus]